MGSMAYKGRKLGRTKSMKKEIVGVVDVEGRKKLMMEEGKKGVCF